jgi:cysteine desulfurase/selenocysteine lyase
MDFFGIPGTIRASFSFYNTIEEIDLMIDALLVAKRMLS